MQHTRSLISAGWWSWLWRRDWQPAPPRRRSAPLRVRQLETRLTPSLTTLASFSGTDGANPYSALIMDASGDLYGTTEYGGASNDGTVFELAGSGTVTTLASFNGTDGADPLAGLMMDANGNLYGTASAGGASGDGTVFEVAHGSGTITTLASFNGADGSGPSGGLVMDGSGNLYGTAGGGGASNYGTVFELSKGSGTITRLASFDSADNGAYPEGGLVMDGSGNLYGTTSYAAFYGDGTVFEVAHGSGTITTLADFNDSTGSGGGNPYGSLIMDASGNLYGTTFNGRHAQGTVFELAKGSGTITTLAWVTGQPEAGLVMDGTGNLYGTSDSGGTSRQGTVFELAQGSSTITTLASFDGTNGSSPRAALFLDGGGNLYGTTVFGGASNDGTVFELPAAAPATDQWTGANFAVDTNWSDGANWSLGTPPTAGQAVLFTNNASVKDFTSTVDAAFTNAIGSLNIDCTWGGTITVNSPLSVTGDLTLASGTIGGSGALTIGGSGSAWTGGQINMGSGGFTNTGTLTADTTAGNLVLAGAGTLTNDGTINEAGTNNLMLENAATLSNAGGAVFDLTGDAGLGQSGGGTLSNTGTLEKTSGTGTSGIALTTFSNTGTVAVSSGTLDISGSVTQVTRKGLTAGTWTVTGSATVHAKLALTSAGNFSNLGAGAQVTLNGPNATFANLKGLRTIATGGSLSLLGGQSFVTPGSLFNAGSITLGAGSTLTVTGSFSQGALGALTIGLGGTDAAPTFGQLVSTTGAVSLAGSLSVTSTVVPVVGSSFELLDNEGTAITGMFAGLAEGATFTVTAGTTAMTFQITYAGSDSDGDHNVILTRIS